ncbi:hypothetical protein [Synechococcus sp. R6-5]|uniref:hypothetical protein n=1 Tax=Synechococcus sp. R6-5 TaxID=2421326 RepID=UPI0039C4E1F6
MAQPDKSPDINDPPTTQSTALTHRRTMFTLTPTPHTQRSSGIELLYFCKPKEGTLAPQKFVLAQGIPPC